MGGRSFVLPCLLLFTTVAGVSLLEDLPTITVSNGEVFSLPLTSYFGGNNLAFSLSAEDNVQATDPFTLAQQANFPYDTANTYDGTAPSSKLLDSFTQLGQTYVLNAVNNDLQAYAIDSKGVLSNVWTYTVAVDGATPTITSITHFTSAGKLYAIALVRSVVDPLTVFEGYLFDVTDMTQAPADPTALGLQSTVYFSEGDILIMPLPFQTLLLVSCNIDKGNSVMVYNVTDTTAITYLWDLSSYADGSPLAPVEIATSSEALYVLDENKGLVSFELTANEFTQRSQLNVNRLGTPTFLEAGVQSLLAVGTTNGLLIVNTVSNSAIKWVPIELANGLWVPYSAFFSDNFVFVTAHQTPNVTVVVIDLTLPFASCVQQQWTLGIPEDSMLPFAMYTFVQLLAPQNYVYLRSDVDALNVYNVAVGKWALTGTANAAGSYSVVVSAYEKGDSEAKVSSTLTVAYMAANNSTVYFGSGFNLTKNFAAAMIVPEIVADTATVSIPVSSWFSGPETMLTVNTGKAPAGITANSSFSKMEVEQAPSHEFLESDGVLMAAENDMLYVRSSSVVLKSVTILWFNYVNSTVVLDGMVWYSGFMPTSMTVNDEDDTVFMLGTSTAPAGILLRGYRLGNKFQAPSVAQTCFQIEIYNENLLCLSPGQIDIHALSDLSLIESITPAMLGLPSLQVLDVSFQVTSHGRNILYISCAINGIFAVDITNLALKPATLPTLMGLAGATSGVYLNLLSPETMAQVNSDGSVLVIDVSNGPSIRLLKTIQSWVTGTFCGATNTESFVVVCVAGQLLFYDVESSIHNALYSVYAMGQECTFQSMHNEVFTLCKTKTDSVVSRVTPTGEWGPNGFVYNIDVSLAINFTYIKTDSNPIPMQVNCSSPLSNFLLTPITINLQNQGHAIFPNTSFNKAIRVHYEETSVFPLSTVFFGQDVSLQLYINGKNRYCPDGVNATDPVVLKPTFERVSFAYDYNDGVMSNFIFLEPGVAVTISGTSLHIFKLDYDTSPSCSQAMEAVEMDNFALLPLLDNPDLIECPILTMVTKTSQSSLLAVYCYSEEGSNQLSLVKLDLNICGCGLSVVASEQLYFEPTTLKTKSSSDGRLFIALLSDSNSFLWTEFTWAADGSVSFTTPLTLVDFISLELDKFCPVDLDVQPLPTGAAIYVADSCFGVRVLNYTTAGPSITLETSFALSTSPTYGLSMCNGSLYTIQESTVLTQFNLTDGIWNLSSVKQIPDFNTHQGVFTPQVASLACSSSTQMLAARIGSDEGYEGVRVFDLLAAPNSAILGSFRLDTLLNYTNQGVTFSNDGYLAALTANGFSIYHVSRPYFYFAPLAKADYNTMVQIWGSHDFQLMISGTNDEMMLNSSSIALKRDSITSSDDNFGSKYWYIWVTIAVISVLVAASCLFCRKRIPGPQNNDSLLHPSSDAPVLLSLSQSHMPAPVAHETPQS